MKSRAHTNARTEPIINAAVTLRRQEQPDRAREPRYGGSPTSGKEYGYIAARDSGTSKVEIDQEQAVVVRRIFDLYANGASPRTIAMTLNDEGVPSPRSQWKRTSRRKSGWLANAIHAAHLEQFHRHRQAGVTFKLRGGLMKSVGEGGRIFDI